MAGSVPSLIFRFSICNFSDPNYLLPFPGLRTKYVIFNHQLVLHRFLVIKFFFCNFNTQPLLSLLCHLWPCCCFPRGPVTFFSHNSSHSFSLGNAASIFIHCLLFIRLGMPSPLFRKSNNHSCQFQSDSPTVLAPDQLCKPYVPLYDSCNLVTFVSVTSFTYCLMLILLDFFFSSDEPWCTELRFSEHLDGKPKCRGNI
jgi:hypothetical protein